MIKRVLTLLALAMILAMAATSGFTASRTDAISQAAQSFLAALDEKQREMAAMPLDTDE